jgi:hypothetical protein
MNFFFRSFGIVILILLSSCLWRSDDYRNFYAHLHGSSTSWQSMQEEDYFLIILVDAPHFDYTKGSKFLQTVAKHPYDGSKNGDFGHAWVYLKGIHNGRSIVIEGGHSGETEEPPARYFDGIMNYFEWGFANPTSEQTLSPCYEPNPIKYLFTVREDGFFQKGSGGHYPTFAAKISLTSKQFQTILCFINPRHYTYRYYALMGHQCCSFVTKVAALAGLSLVSETSIKVAPYVYFGRRWIRLWEDPFYAEITLATPDVVEKSLMEAVKNGQAQYALDWYLKYGEKSM